MNTLGKLMNTMETDSKTMEKIDEQCKWHFFSSKIQESTCFCSKL